MRLLYTTHEGRLKWTEDLIGDVPEYAILSHTWKHGEEVTFYDLESLGQEADIGAQRKEGYQKIRFCAQQAKKDGLSYFWIDTCCIDKSNSTELQEAINSMFRWYQNAKICYVYLTDVKDGASGGDGDDKVEALKKSRWFTRGWTLQELLAPSSVDFFSSDGMKLGTKESLKDVVHQITRLPVEALTGRSLSTFRINDRFSWAQDRQTTRGEDSAYCLLGIFGIYMPLIYGEGRENALRRLRNKVERFGRLPNWLTAPDPSINQYQSSKQRQADTGIWFLESNTFDKWTHHAASRLWLYGIPGCGKTILSSTVIEHMLHYCHADVRLATAYFYFDFSDSQKQNPGLMLRSLIGQLLPRMQSVPEILGEVLISENMGQQPSLYVLLDIFRQIVAEISQVYIILDALDECSQRPELFEILTAMDQWGLLNLHILMTSRKERDIEEALMSFFNEEHTLSLESAIVDEDIRRYVKHRLSEDPSLRKWRKDATIMQDIECALVSGARGMYGISPQHGSSRRLTDFIGFDGSLANLSHWLSVAIEQTYDRMLCRISDQDFKYARRILQWLSCSVRPLYIEEIAEIIAIDVQRDPAFDSNEVLEDPFEALKICPSLLTTLVIQSKSDLRVKRIVFTLAHYSVQEYLLSDRLKQGTAKLYSMRETACHAEISRSCLRYFIQLYQPGGPSVHELKTAARADYPAPPPVYEFKGAALTNYSAQFWDYHLRRAGEEMNSLSNLAITLLSTDNTAYLAWLSFRALNNIYFSVEEPAGPLYCATHMGLSAVVQSLLEAGADPNRRLKDGLDTPLYLAILRGHATVVKILLDAGADVDYNGVYSDIGRGLYIASLHGHARIVKMLLDRVATINASVPVRVYADALLAATDYDQQHIVQLLLEYGVVKLRLTGDAPDPKTSVMSGRSSIVRCIQKAASQGRSEALGVLLTHGADSNATDAVGRTCLHIASQYGYFEVTKLLLGTNTNLNVVDNDGRTALNLASINADAQTVELLLVKGAHQGIADKDGRTPLIAACARGMVEVTRILLNHGAELTLADTQGRTALQLACAAGFLEVIKLLLEVGAHANITDEVGKTPLNDAAQNGMITVGEEPTSFSMYSRPS
ncbi:hypothetical protein NX059_001812 [Plenodomus lindquistii]|nr:hypothetical protein NX059_001812 [Plenodomus lindquistii]